MFKRLIYLASPYSDPDPEVDELNIEHRRKLNNHTRHRFCINLALENGVEMFDGSTKHEVLLACIKAVKS